MLGKLVYLLGIFLTLWIPKITFLIKSTLLANYHQAKSRRFSVRQMTVAMSGDQERTKK